MLTTAPILKVEGQALSWKAQDALVSVRISRELDLSGRVVLRLEDVGFELATSGEFDLGTKVELSDFETDTKLAAGVVTGVALEQSPQWIPELVVTIDDAIHLLTRSSGHRTFLNQTYAQAVKKVVDPLGLSLDDDVRGAVTHAYLMQSGSDLAFVEEAARRSGAAFWIDPAKPKAIKFTKLADTAPTGPTVTMGKDLARFSVRTTNLDSAQVKVVGWDPQTQKPVVGASQPGPYGESALAQNVPGRGPRAMGSQVVIDHSPTTQVEAETIADALFDDARSAGVVLRGTTPGNAALKPAGGVTVAGAGPADGTYWVTAVEHVYDSRGFNSTFVAGSRRPSALVDTLGPAAVDPGFTMPGMVVAKVTNVNDPDKLGRAKVKYATPEPQLESTWARIVTLGAGAGRGLVFQPEVDDEVLVGFEHGDTRRPVILGGLFSAVSKLPTADQSNVANNRVTSRRITSRLNHVVELADGDSPATQHVLLKTGTAEHRIRLGKDRLDIEVSDVPVVITNGKAKVEMTASGDLTLSGVNVTVKATQNLALEGAQVSVKGTKGVTVQGLKVEVKGDASAALQAGGPVTVKGATVAIN